MNLKKFFFSFFSFLFLLFSQFANVPAQETGSWVRKFKGYWADHISIDQNSPNIVYAGIDTINASVTYIWKSTDYGETWQPQIWQTGEFPYRVGPGYYGDVKVAPDSSNYIYVLSFMWPNRFLTLVYTTDGGANWIETEVESNEGGGMMRIAPSEPNVIYVSVWITPVIVLYRSMDRGATWEKFFNTPFNRVADFAVHPYNSHILYLGNQYGIFKSVDGGETWEWILSEPFPDTVATSITTILIDPSNPEILYAGTRGYGVFKSTNGGQEWKTINNGLPPLAQPPDWQQGFHLMAINHKNTQELFLSYYQPPNYSFLYRSTDGGTNWEKFNTGLPYIPASIAIDTTFGKIYAGLYGGDKLDYGGIYVYETSTSVVIPKKPNTLPKSFQLFQNYPNPFNPITNIDYQLTKSNKVTLTIYNLLGEEVRTLVNENQLPGYYTVQWNGEDDKNKKVSTGVYFYQLRLEGENLQKETKKMLLIK